MKPTRLLIALLAGTLGVLAYSPKLIADDSPNAGCPMSGCKMSGCTMPSCCGGMTTPMGDSVTNAVPDLLTTCPVSGEKLDEMGKPFVFVYKDQEVKLCCKGCKKDFDKDPAKYMKLIRAADKKK
jgi:hypothetical protein